MIDLWVSSAENLPSADPNGLSDPYTNVQSKAFGVEYLLTKTEIKFKTLDPVWDGDYSKPLRIPFVCVDDLDLEIYDYDRFSSDDYLGTVNSFFKVENNDKELKLPVSVKKGTKGPPSITIKYRLPTQNFPSDQNIKKYNVIYAYLTYSSPVASSKGVSPVQLSVFNYENSEFCVKLMPLSNSKQPFFYPSENAAHYGPTGYTNVYKFVLKNMKKANEIFVFTAKSSEYEGDVSLHFVAANETKKKNMIIFDYQNSFKIMKSCTISITKDTTSTFPVNMELKKGVISYVDANVLSSPNDNIEELFKNIGHSIDENKPFWRRLTLYHGTTVSLSSAVDFHHVQFPTSIAVGLGWDTVTDLDGSCIIYKKLDDGKFKDIAKCCYSSLKVLKGIVRHSGDNLTGKGDGDDEVITIKLQELPEEAKLLAITVTSFGGVPFNRISGGFLRIMDARTHFELMYLPLSNQQQKTGLIFAFLIKGDDNVWDLVPCLRYVDAKTPPIVNEKVLELINNQEQFEELMNFQNQ
ncbi:stress-induced protein [Histomonas meleagridis]|uniref:stress-induced protein n=1 Tax=Histomonas meleagridis TaxID=135588 RepID=UPI00355AC3E1|nr:stress-induced protein [Histomonas meleagridis]KAH0797603.1 stress-induced protein [Histomonas meleagridis]